MLIAIYVNFRTEEIYSEADFQETIREKQKEIVNNERKFEEWLEQQFCPIDIFKLSEKEKKQELKNWENCAKEMAEDFLFEEDGWKKTVLEI